MSRKWKLFCTMFCLILHTVHNRPKAYITCTHFSQLCSVLDWWNLAWLIFIWTFYHSFFISHITVHQSCYMSWLRLYIKYSVGFIFSFVYMFVLLNQKNNSCKTVHHTVLQILFCLKVLCCPFCAARCVPCTGLQRPISLIRELVCCLYDKPD